MEPVKIISIALISLGILAIVEAIFILIFKKQLLKAIKYFNKPHRIVKLSKLELIIGIIILIIGCILLSL